MGKAHISLAQNSATCVDWNIVWDMQAGCELSRKENRFAECLAIYFCHKL